MSTSVTITGTGCPIPDADRAGPGVLVRTDELALQFDVGRSTVQRLAGADVWIPDLDAVFVTHHHSDHLTGLADLVLTHWTMDRRDESPPLPVLAPRGPAAAYVAGVLDGWDADIDVRGAHAGRPTRPQLDAIGFEAREEVVPVWRSGDVVVSARHVRHEPCPVAVGYRVDTPDGSVAITGDTRVCDEVAQLADGVDVLVYEAMRFAFFDDLPPHRRYVTDYHADTRLIGEQAAALDVPVLVLTHLIPAPTTHTERQAYRDDVRAGGFEGELIVADDLFTAAVGSGGLPRISPVVQTAERQWTDDTTPGAAACDS